jgi:Tfp pilus assembly protein PilE
MLKNARGVTLTELMVATVLLSVGILGFFNAFRHITASITISRARTLATNLAQEKVELLKNLSYYQLLITTSSSIDNDFTPPVVYDDANYPAEIISIGGVAFKRYTYVALAQVDSNSISTVTYTYPDTGMKQITVHITWQQGTERKKWTLSNLIENPNVNPLDSSLSGTISSAVTGVPISGALVKVQENPDWNATTDSSGYYTFRVYHGSYTVRASSSGWHDATSSVQSATSGSNTTLNMSMSKIASGTISGNLWMNTDLVISQIVVDSDTYKGDGTPQSVEYIELFNPTTAALNIGAGAVKHINVNYYGESGLGQDCNDACFNFTYVSTYVPPGRYYLLANASYFLMDGSWYAADAYWAGDRLVTDRAGSLQVTRPSTGLNVDLVGWADNDNPPVRYEGNYIPDSTAFDGLGQGNQIVRVSSPAASFDATGTYGKAYDSGDNRDDFLYPNDVFVFPPLPLFYSPRNTAHSAETVISGKPAYGAYVAATDALSGSTQAVTMTISSGALSLNYAYFKLNSVATGTWSVVTASGTWYKEVSNVIVSNGANTRILNALTSPVQLLADNYAVYLDSSHPGGFIAGRVTGIGNNVISGIAVDVGGVSKTTGGNGTFFAKVSSGPVTIVANPNNANSTYQQGITLVEVAQGQIAVVDFILSQGGTLSGFVTTGTTPLPNIVVTANIGGSQYGTGTSDSAGVFYIRNLSTGTYIVAPVLEAGQDSNPNSYSPTVTVAATVQVGTFTVSGAFGSIIGTVRNNGEIVTTGALILASTATIPSTPTSIAGSSSPALTPLYAVSSRADGSYALPVRGSAATYRVSAYIPVIATNGTVTITTKTYSGISVSPSASTTQDVSIP